ncbi:hypothetical protein BJF92_15515 [Rhizobium rhizosphaerae]|uniref:Uncharacterized protein n=1 Tax=Xaviernesmea rhizosphaerae TaxID=1672749 RepID=A0A1Q9ALS5_9HYPH|nr:hypothetical protein BJF92_15515 [Xaviernesmea rhizosphaerae]
MALCEASFSRGSATRRFGYPLVDGIDGNIVQFEATAITFHDFAILLILRLCHRVEEVLGRRVPVAVEEARL